MPVRILRDCTDSEPLNRISMQAEVLFFHLIMKADDYGRYHADPRLLRSYLFPRRDLRCADLSRWLAECEQSGLIVRYEGADGKPYAAIRKFNQRMRSKTSRFPAPPESLLPDVPGPVPDVPDLPENAYADGCRTDAGPLTSGDGSRETGIGTEKNASSGCPESDLPLSALCGEKFRIWVEIWETFHGNGRRMPRQIRELALADLLRIPEANRIESLEAAIGGQWKRIYERGKKTFESKKWNGKKDFEHGDDPRNCYKRFDNRTEAYGEGDRAPEL